MIKNFNTANWYEMDAGSGGFIYPLVYHVGKLIK